MGRGTGWVAVGFVAAIALVAGCDSSGSESTSTTRSAPRASLQMRPVVVMVPPPTEVEGQAIGAGPGYDMLDGTAASKGVRYGVGPVTLTERDVAEAHARKVPTVGWVVDLELNRHGTRALNDLAAELYPKQAPQNAVAIVVDGKVQSAPAFQEPRFLGGQVEMIGGYTAQQAKRLAASLEP